ncbi:MAG: phosphatase PAP2 family protein [Cyanobium sp. M30B3]|nr:MAG: phosphatase PAP2 family protein [Cyanobium sp. M30B3]
MDPYGALAIASSRLRLPSIHEIREVGDPLLAVHAFPASRQDLANQLEELLELQDKRCSNEIGSAAAGRERAPLSQFLQARANDRSGFKDQHKVGGPTIQTGADLARWFENDTPLLGGWMALSVLFKKYAKPPTEQAFIWEALNAVISTALLAAWHYKWIEPVSRLKPRPTEVLTEGLTVLYGFNESGDEISNPTGFSGVPRHPTYPSGHSTVGGATAAILKRFFTDPEDTRELDNLADNAGLARMWAGIHYRADHTFGIALGDAVAQLVYPGTSA